MDEKQKRKLTPWIVEKTKYLQRKPKSVRSNGKNTFLVEVQNEIKGCVLKDLTAINEVQVQTTENKTVNTCRGFTSIKECDLSDHQTLALTDAKSSH